MKRVNLNSLERRKAQLLKAIREKAISDSKINQEKRKRENLLKEINRLERINLQQKSKVRSNFARLYKNAKSPETKAKIAKAKKKASSLFKGFQKFANRYG